MSCMGYAWQKENKDRFKPTLPYFDRGIVRAKQRPFYSSVSARLQNMRFWIESRCSYDS